MVNSTILRKTRTAADYVHTHSPNPLTRSRAAAVLHNLAAVHVGAATDAARDAAWGPGEQVDPVALRDLVAAVADCAGTGWLQANAHDPDIGRVTALLDAPQLLPGDPAELDELLATVLWASHGPQPALAAEAPPSPLGDQSARR